MKSDAALRPATVIVLSLVAAILTFTGCGGGGTAGTSTTHAANAGDFNLSVSPSALTTTAGTTDASFTVATSAQNGFADPVTIGISGLPAGARTSPATPFTVAAGKQQTVNLAVPAATGNFPLTVTANSGSISHSAPLALTINPRADFSLAISPTMLTAAPGSSNSSFTVVAVGQNGFSGSVNVTISGLPAGATISPSSPFTIAPGAVQKLTLSIPGSLSQGNYTVVLNAASGSLTHSANLALTVSSLPDFALAISPAALTATAGTPSSRFSATIIGENGFTGSVSVAISGLPEGASTSPASPFNVAAGSSQAVSISIPASALPGTYSVQANAISGSLSHNTNFMLTVNPAPDFGLVLSPTSLAAGAGTSSSTFTASITPQNGFTGSVAIALSGIPNGASTNPASPFSVAAGTSQNVSVSVPAGTATGNYGITATGSSGSLTHSAVMDLLVTGQASITTWHYDNARTGANINETTLSPANVNSATFGKLATFPVDGFVVGHPLYLEAVNIPGQGLHNVVYAATMNDSVYAFDADSTSTTPLWTTSILTYSPAGATPVPASVKRGSATTGWSQVGIVSTPVIDPATNTLYLVAETYESGNVVHRLHALDVRTGTEIPGAPVTITASYTLNGTTTVFKDLYQMNRPGLLLVNGHIYIAFGSNCCNDYSQGWLLSYNATTLQQEGAYTTEPGRTLASIWQKGAGVSTDGIGNVYAETGEGFYAPGTNLSASVLKIFQNGTSLQLTDWFTPYNYQSLSQSDLDLSNAVLILPDQPGEFPHEAVAIGKQGTIYLLNRDNMGKLCDPTVCTSADTQIVQEIPKGAGGESNTPVYWNNTLYFSGAATPVFAYTMNNGTLMTPPSAQSMSLVGNSHPMITANGTTNGILWLIESSQWLMAFDAVSLQLLYQSNQASGGRDTLPPVAHFAVPIAADGKVFIGTQTSVVVYGLLSGSAALKTSVSTHAALLRPFPVNLGASNQPAKDSAH